MEEVRQALGVAPTLHGSAITLESEPPRRGSAIALDGEDLELTLTMREELESHAVEDVYAGLEESVLTHLRHEIRRRRSNTGIDGHVLAAAYGVYIAARGTNVTALFILEVGKIKASSLLYPLPAQGLPAPSEETVLRAAQAGADLIARAVTKKSQAAGYTLEAIVRVPATVTGHELFYEFDQLDVVTTS